MDQKPETIMRHIEAQRARLGENLEHLEHRVRSATDWHTWVRRKPLTLLGVAFGGGLLAALRIGR